MIEVPSQVLEGQPGVALLAEVAREGQGDVVALAVCAGVALVLSFLEGLSDAVAPLVVGGLAGDAVHEGVGGAADSVEAHAAVGRHIGSLGLGGVEVLDLGELGRTLLLVRRQRPLILPVEAALHALGQLEPVQLVHEALGDAGEREHVLAIAPRGHLGHELALAEPVGVALSAVLLEQERVLEVEVGSERRRVIAQVGCVRLATSELALEQRGGAYQLETDRVLLANEMEIHVLASVMVQLYIRNGLVRGAHVAHVAHVVVFVLTLHVHALHTLTHCVLHQPMLLAVLALHQHVQELLLGVLQ